MVLRVSVCRSDCTSLPSCSENRKRKWVTFLEPGEDRVSTSTWRSDNSLIWPTATSSARRRNSGHASMNFASSAPVHLRASSTVSHSVGEPRNATDLSFSYRQCAKTEVNAEVVRSDRNVKPCGFLCNLRMAGSNLK